MNVELLAHTQLSRKFVDKLKAELDFDMPFTSGQAVALSAIRTCYSPGKPSEIVAKEGEKYFGNKATDGKEGTEADRLFRMIVRSGPSRRPSGLRKTIGLCNSLAHRTTWLRSDFARQTERNSRKRRRKVFRQ